jgi:indolepyruvate ferredoxin oxidoreductase
MAASGALRKPHYPLDNYELDDRYRRESGRVFLTGTQALVRIPLMQRTMDRAAGLNTAGFISGYRGSPLAAYDTELWRAGKFLEESNVTFLPAVNEELAATAILGTQQVEADPHKQVDGVFGIWYGKGPGVDRAGDGLKHGNAYGSSPHGGVLVVAGDDHGAVSSSMSHQSDVAFLTWLMPNLNPRQRCRVSRVRTLWHRAVPLLGHVGRLQGNIRNRRVGDVCRTAAVPELRHP